MDVFRARIGVGLQECESRVDFFLVLDRLLGDFTGIAFVFEPVEFVQKRHRRVVRTEYGQIPTRSIFGRGLKSGLIQARESFAEFGP